MLQLSFWWKKFKKLRIKTQDGRLFFADVNFKELRKLAGWMLCGLAIAAIWFWNWQLLLATMAGVSLMLLVYWLQTNNWQSYLLEWRRFLTGQHRHLTIAVSSGSIGALSTYIASSVWANSENRWLAVGSILQGLGTMITLGLFFWQFFIVKIHTPKLKFEEILRDLTDVTTLKRLIAVRQLSNLLDDKYLSKSEREQLLEYFRVMLSVEEELVVRDAIWESLNKCNTQELEILQQPLKLPLETIQ